MKRFFPILASAILLLAAAAAAQTAGNEVTGFYSVRQATDLGTMVRVTLHIRLVNNTPQELSILRVDLGVGAARAAPRGQRRSAVRNLESGVCAMETRGPAGAAGGVPAGWRAGTAANHSAEAVA